MYRGGSGDVFPRLAACELDQKQMDARMSENDKDPGSRYANQRIVCIEEGVTIFVPRLTACNLDPQGPKMETPTSESDDDRGTRSSVSPSCV